MLGKQRVLRTDLWRMFPTCIPDSGSMGNCDDPDNPCIQTGIVFRSACFKCGAASFNIAVYICIAGCSALVISSYFMRDDIPVVGKHRNCLSPIRKNPPAIFWAIASPFLEILQLFSNRLCSTYAQSPAAANFHGHGSKC